MKKSPFFSYKNYMLKEYAHALYSIPVDLEFGCPNRAFDGSGGCSFCPSDGARAIQIRDAKSIEEQIQKAVSFAKRRYKAKHFMLYIQAYTGTFSSLKEQKESYLRLLQMYDFEAISIGTRPDCLGLETLEFLQELNKSIDVHIDLGIQTLNDTTLLKINRGHDAKSSLQAIEKLKAYGLKVFAHVIIGLPDESREDFENTIKKIVTCKVDGIKFHNLHIIKNTTLHEEYKQKPFKLYNEYEYAQELMHLLRLIPSHIPILRLATDTPSKELIAPIWHMQKGQFGEYVIENMLYQDIAQGDLVQPQTSLHVKKLQEPFWSQKFKEYYHPKSGAEKQAKELFVDKSELEKKLTCKDIKLLDIGFGFGYNTLEALKLKHENFLHVKALDIDRSILKHSTSQVIQTLYESGMYADKSSQIEFIVGDIRHTLKSLDEQFDVIFLDPFCEDKNASMISLEVFQLLKKLLAKEGVLVSSTFRNSVRVGLCEAGFQSKVIEIGDIKGLVVTHGKQHLEGKPYRDTYLVYPDKQIVTNREKA